MAKIICVSYGYRSQWDGNLINTEISKKKIQKDDEAIKIILIRIKQD